jgi:hypothetical protein
MHHSSAIPESLDLSGLLFLDLLAPNSESSSSYVNILDAA